MRGEIFGMLGATMLAEIRGCADEQNAHLAKPAGEQTGIRQARNPQCEIKSLADNIDDLIAETQVHRNVRAEFEKVRQ